MKDNKSKEGFGLKNIIVNNIICLMVGIVLVGLGKMTRSLNSNTVFQEYPYIYCGVTITMLVGVIILFPIIYHGIYRTRLILIHKTMFYFIELILGIFIMTAIIYGLTNYPYLDIINGVFGNGEFDRLTQMLLGLCNMVSIGMFVGIFTNMYEKDIDDSFE